MVAIATVTKEDDKTLLEGLDFILSHFQQRCIWPRNISTYTTEGRQLLVFNKEEALARFKQSNFLDCRISAYPSYTDYKGINRQAPDFIFIDLDRSTFKTERAHKLALNVTLKNISEKVDGKPTVIWSGNGYHIYQPVEGLVLEQIEQFIKFEQPSKSFQRFAEWYLSNGKSDEVHNATVSLKNCMLRIPATHNSKCLQDSEVKIIRRWDGHRPKINLLLGSFYAYLVDHEVKEMKEVQRHNNYSSNVSRSHNNAISWIEKLLQTPIENYRKTAVWQILAPYLINVRKLSYEEGFSVIKEWLDRCNNLNKLDFNRNSKIREGLNGALKGYFPISLDNLKIKCNELYCNLERGGVY